MYYYIVINVSGICCVNTVLYVELFTPPCEGFGLEYPNLYYRKSEKPNGLDCEVSYGLLDISP